MQPPRHLSKVNAKTHDMDVPNTIPNIIIWLKKNSKNGSHVICLRELEGNWA